MLCVVRFQFAVVCCSSHHLSSYLLMLLLTVFLQLICAQQTVEVVEEVVRGYKGVLLVVSHGEGSLMMYGLQEVVRGFTIHPCYSSVVLLLLSLLASPCCNNPLNSFFCPSSFRPCIHGCRCTQAARAQGRRARAYVPRILLRGQGPV